MGVATIGDVVSQKAATVADGERPAPVTVADLMRNGGVAVIVGGRASNFPESFRRWPRLVFWDSMDKMIEKRTLPSNTRAVLLLRWVSHHVSHRIVTDAKRRGIHVVPGLASTGDVRDHLQPAMDQSSTTISPSSDGVVVSTTNKDIPMAMAPAKQLRKLKNGELSAFVLQHADRAMTSWQPASPEVKRLLTLLNTQGIASTAGSISDCIRQRVLPNRRLKYRHGSPSRQAPQTPAVVVVQEMPVEVRLAERRREIVAASAGQHDPLLMSLDEAEKYLADMKAAADLLGTLLPQLRTEIGKFRDQQRRARELFKLDN